MELWLHQPAQPSRDSHRLGAFRPSDNETRLEFVAGLYAMHCALGGKAATLKSVPFTDVSKDSEDYPAVLWGYESGVIKGVSATAFDPSGTITRESACAMLVRFARADGITLATVADAEQFGDSLNVSQYARSAVTACQMSGLVNGYNNGYFRPKGFISARSARRCSAACWTPPSPRPRKAPSR